ncbi:AP2-like ethylene-responsive transcription factor AIL1 [Chenopodium quinoa]|nr:AP2-like ethylene-responsive transcription factor AIL1 [Chenopodium quinoa]
MASMNWLGFSLSPQEIPSQTPNQDHHNPFTSTTGECFDLATDSPPGHPSLNHLPPPFGILEAFHRSTNNQSQDWNMKGNSEISMLMGNQEVEEEPKLENFLGSSHSFRENNHQQQQSNGDHYMFNTTTTPQENNNMANPKDTTSNNNNNGLNVSMIKTWLRSNHPSQSNLVDGSGGGGGGGGAGLTNAQTLSLSMGTGGSHSALPLLATGGGGGSGGEIMESKLSDNSSCKQQQQSDATTGVCNNTTSSTTTTNVEVQSGALVESVPRKSIDTFGQRTSIYRGVTRHRWTGRYEAHLWDNSCRREGQTRKGRQVYLGGYDKEEKAARAYDLAALKYWGTTTTTNFPITDYEKEIEDMKHMTRQEYVASLRRKSSGFSRGASIYRGVTRHHQHGRWQARIGRVAGNKDLYLGTFSTQEEAAEAYDIAAIKFRGLNAVTNFEINRYDVKAILDSTTLPIGGAAKRLKDVEELTAAPDKQIIRAIAAVDDHETSQLTNAAYGNGTPNFHSWPGIAFPTAQAQPLAMHYPYAASQQQQQQRLWCKQEVQDTTHDYQDHLNQQLQLNNGTHNFFQMHNLMGLENPSSTLEHTSAGSNPGVYGNGSGNESVGGGGYGLPFGMSTVIAHEGNENGNEKSGYENYYYYSHQGNNASNATGVRGAVGTYDQGTSCNNWVPTAIPALVPRPNNMAAVGGHGGGAIPTFTVWNDT